jgi:hypothetical protein
MVEPVALTLGEVVAVLDPPMTEQQLVLIIRALGWQPVGCRHNGKPGRPQSTYDATRLLALHAALSPFNGG